MRSVLPLLLLGLCTTCAQVVQAAQTWQTARAKKDTLRVATYNVENLFDTLNHPGVQEPVSTPETYRTRLRNLAGVIAALQPDVLGLCEVENSGVVSDLLQTPPLDRLPYRFIHYDSRDSRGIDVALAYRSDRLTVLESEPIAPPRRYPSRDILRVEALAFRRDTMVFYVVHFPSRRGGRSSADRIREEIADSLNASVLRELPGRTVVVLGDLNDNPVSKLLTRHLPALRSTGAEAFRRGQGSYAWRDSWLMYDHILVNSAAATAGEARVLSLPRMLTPTGRFRGYPYRNVFSDHLPVYLQLVF